MAVDWNTAAACCCHVSYSSCVVEVTTSSHTVDTIGEYCPARYFGAKCYGLGHENIGVHCYSDVEGVEGATGWGEVLYFYVYAD